MDSLLASYASSDEEEQEDSKQQQQQPQLNQNQSTSRKSTVGGAFSSSLPPPKSSSFQSLISKIPPPKSQTLEPEKPKSSSSLFSLLPQPKTLKSDNPPISLEPKPKKVVQLLRPQVNPSVFNSKDDDEDSDEEKPKRKSVGFETPTVKSFLSSIPAPRNSGSLGALPSAAGTGRRSVLAADVRPAVSSSVKTVKESREDNVGYDGLSNSSVGADLSTSGLGGGNLVNHDGYGGAEASNLGSGSNDFVNYDHYGGGGGGGDPLSYGPVREDYANYQSLSDYSGNYGQGQYESRWIDRSGGEVSAPEVEGVGAHISSSAVENVIRIGKRGRNDVPVEVVEVKQDELMKNRPREDKAKATGIAFGPTYQPVSTKGKPTKLHKRKHQIDSLYFDMRQKEMELAERRSKGFLTKAETQAKYGW